MFHSLFQKYLKIIDRYIVVLALLAILCGVVGQYMMSWDLLWAPNIDQQYISELADPSGKIIGPLEPLARGLKVVGGYDSYVFHENDFHSVWQDVGYHVFEVGRWLGYIVYFRAIMWLIHASFATLDEERKTKTALKQGKDVVAIHGDSLYAAALAKNLIDAGHVVVVTDARLLPALGDKAPSKASAVSVALQSPIQVVMYDSDQEALDFLEKNDLTVHPDAHVFIRLDDLVPDGLFADNVVPFSMALICATMYWARYPIYLTNVARAQDGSYEPAAVAHALSRPKGDAPRYRVVIIGDTDFTEQILEVGLLANISDITGGIRYDVIGDVTSWRLMHPGLDDAVAMNADELHFHSGAWYEHRRLLLDADRVILCGRSSDNVRIASELQSEPIRKLHIRANNKSSLIVLGQVAEDASGPMEVVVFGTLDELCTPNLILQGKTNENGKLLEVLHDLETPRCNACETFDFSAIPSVREEDVADEERIQKIRDARLSLIHDAGGEGLRRCLTCPRFEAAWAKKDMLSRRNNYAESYHTSQKYRLMSLMGIPPRVDVSVAEGSEEYRRLPDEAKEALREVEHIRWCRFYFLNGWTYAPGARDTRARTHPQLRPYAEVDVETDRLRRDNGYLNICQIVQSDEMQRWVDSVWLGDESEGETPAAAVEAQMVAMATEEEGQQS